MKTLILIALLSKAEIKEVALLLKQRNRASLEALWKYLVSDKDATNKSLLFKSVFGETFTAEKDYLLRNELRLLNNILEDYIAQAEALGNVGNSELQRDLHILERMLRLGKHVGFEKLCADAERKATAAANFDLLGQLLALKAQYIIRHKEVSVANYQEVASILAQQETINEMVWREKQAQLTVRQKFAQRVLQAVNPDGQLADNGGNPQTLDMQGYQAILHYHELMGKIYEVHGEEKISVIKELIARHPEVVKLRPNLQKDLANLYGNLALELFLLNRFEQADGYYEQAVKVLDKNNMSVDLLFNYCINALSLGKYDTFVDIYNTYYNGIIQSEKIKYRFQYFAAIAALFQNRPDEAFRLLDQNISQRPVHEYYYYRIVYAMVYYQGGDAANANRELDNILQSFRFRTNAQAQDKPLIKLMQKLVGTEALAVDKQLYQDGIAKVNTEIQNASTTHSGFSTIIYKWLQWQVGQKLETQLKKS